MLTAIRDRLTGWVAYTIVILLSIPFALWGIHSYTEGGGPTEVARVGKAEISQNDFQRAFRQQLVQLQNQGIDPSGLDDDLLRHSVLDQLINASILQQTSERLGFRVSDEQLGRMIRTMPAFQDNGRFAMERYQRRLLQEGYSPVGFEQMLRESLVAEQLQQGLTESAFFSDADLRDYLSLQNQQRRFDYLVFSLDDQRRDITLDEADIEAYYQANQQRFLSPEQVKLEFLELTIDALAADIPVDEQEIQAEYQRRLSQLSIPERRSASHILVRLDAGADADAVGEARSMAEQLHQRIATEAADFTTVMEESRQQSGIEGGELGIIEPGFMDSSFETALFELPEPGAISEPVRTGFGFHIIRLDDIREGEITPLEEIREELEQDLRMARAERQFFDAAETLANLGFEQPDSLFPAADALDLTVQETDWIDRSGGEGIARYSQVLDAAFGFDVLEERLNSEALEIEPGHVIVVRIAEHRPATTLTLEQARERIVEELRDQHAGERLDARLEDALAAARDGVDLEQLAADTGALLERSEPVARTAGGLDRRLLDTVFQLPPPGDDDVRFGTGQLANDDRVLLALREVIPGEVALDSPEIRDLRRQLAFGLGDRQFRGFVENRREQLDIRIRESRL